MDDRSAVGRSPRTGDRGEIWQWLHLDRRYERYAGSELGVGSR